MDERRRGPLEGVRVLEMGRLIAAPFCAQILGDLGAEVIKVERVGGGDDVRTYGPPFLSNDASLGGQSSYFLAFNRNKRSVAIDFSKPEGAELVRDLARKSDVFIENYRVGALRKYGLDEQSIRKLKEDIVYLSVSGFGQTGPYADRPATDLVLQGMSGLMSMTGEADRAPMKVGVSIVDMMTGLYGAIGIISSLYGRQKAGGGGEWVGVSLLDSALSVLGAPAIWNYLTGQPPLRSGNSALGTVPSDVVSCRDGDILIQAGKDSDFVKLCSVLGLEHLLVDPRFSTRVARTKSVDQLMPIIQEAVGEWERAAFYSALVDAGIICGPINDIGQALMDPQAKANGAEVAAGHPDDPGLKLISSPIRFSSGAPEVFHHPPRLGEHTGEILEALLGLDPDRIRELEAKGVVGQRTRWSAEATA